MTEILRQIGIDHKQIENNLVKNQFIINQGIEQTVLIENADEGQRFMKERGPSSTNVKMCFTFSNGDKRRGRVINYTGAGGINNSPIDEYRGQLRMQVDKEAQIRYVTVLRHIDNANHCEDKKNSNSRSPSKQRMQPGRSLRGSWTWSTLARHRRRTIHVLANS